MSDLDPTLRPDGRPMDRVDRELLSVDKKLELVCHEMRVTTGTDPRGGGHTFVGRPRCVLQLLCDAPPGTLRLERPIIAGRNGADIVAYWRDVPVRLRCNVVGNDLRCIALTTLPESRPDDRRLAGGLRVLAHKIITMENRRMTVDEATEVLP